VSRCRILQLKNVLLGNVLLVNVLLVNVLEEIMKQDGMARRYHQHLSDIGKFHCGAELAYAGRFKL
jgi:hypothetical protein